jgi:hypothetical protein
MRLYRNELLAVTRNDIRDTREGNQLTPKSLGLTSVHDPARSSKFEFRLTVEWATIYRTMARFSRISMFLH